jgi:hypothetical protein
MLCGKIKNNVLAMIDTERNKTGEERMEIK